LCGPRDFTGIKFYGKTIPKQTHFKQEHLSDFKRSALEYVVPGITKRMRPPTVTAESALLCTEDYFYPEGNPRAPIRVAQSGIDECIEQYKLAGVRHRYQPIAANFDQLFDAAIEDISNNGGENSTPGWPWNRVSATNEKLLKEKRAQLRQEVKTRFANIGAIRFAGSGSQEEIEPTEEEQEQEEGLYEDGVHCGARSLRALRCNPFLWLEWGLCDPVRVFKKNEPEATRKKHGRIVNGVSIIDQILTRMIFRQFNLSAKARFPDVPNMKGTGFDDATAEKIYTRFRKTDNKVRQNAPNATAVTSDISGWEKGYSIECADAFRQVFKATCEYSPQDEPEMDNMLGWWMFKTLGRLCINDDGWIFALDRHIGQSSGDLQTTDANGAARVSVAYANGAHAAFANGDDCVEWTDKDGDAFINGYLTQNVMARDVVKVENDEYPFCSHMFTRDVGGRAFTYLKENEKMIFKVFLKKSYTMSEFNNYMAELQNHPDKQLVKRFLVKLLEAVQRTALQ
jgi:hypothetical protein